MENTEGQKANARGEKPAGENNGKIKNTVGYSIARCVVPAWGGLQRAIQQARKNSKNSLKGRNQ